MRKFIIILSIIFCGIISADVLPYKPKPIIWVHGLGGGSGDWGAPTENRSDSIPKDSIAAHPEGSYSHFLSYILPMVYKWDSLDPSYTKPGDENIPPGEGYYPNKTFLEVINFDYNNGSIDADSTLVLFRLIVTNRVRAGNCASESKRCLLNIMVLIGRMTLRQR